MIIKAAVFTTEGYIIESFEIFNSCLHCGYIRQKDYYGTYIIKGKKKRAHWCKCGCIEQLSEIEMIMEEMTIKELKSRGIVCNKIT